MKSGKSGLRIGAVASIYRFGTILNTNTNFYACVVDGVFEAVPGEDKPLDTMLTTRQQRWA